MCVTKVEPKYSDPGYLCYNVRNATSILYIRLHVIKLICLNSYVTNQVYTATAKRPLFKPTMCN